MWDRDRGCLDATGAEERGCLPTGDEGSGAGEVYQEGMVPESRLGHFGKTGMKNV